MLSVFRPERNACEGDFENLSNILLHNYTRKSLFICLENVTDAQEGRNRPVKSGCVSNR